MNPDLTPISLQETFCFACNPDVPCFNACCRDLNQFLTPYDILRLKMHLGLSSEQFLAQYTLQHTGPGSGLPVVTLKPVDNHDLCCPFLMEKGCSVYENRPSSCRMYPLVRAAAYSRKTGEISERYMLLKEPHCLGYNQGNQRIVQKWIEDQKIADYIEINDKLIHIISLKNRLMPGVLDLKSRHLFFTALYDLDGFRSRIINKGLLGDFQIDSSVLEKALEDDVALLEVGMSWIQRVLFGQK
ncbi:MAG: YkgJ family cysteine cluster protein [Desulfobacterales bacterium]|nr:MAG: YkgJ family cysteine cluster protein [Desulfobacterales bacterium]